MTGAATAVTSASATLNGTVNPDGSQINDCHFTISPAPPAGGSIPCPQQIGAGSTPVAVSAGIGGLAPSTAYSVTLVASSAQGTGSGAPVTFSTPAPGAAPTVTVLSLSPSRFRRGSHAATIARARPRHKAKTLPTATTISFALSQPATVTLSFQRAQPGVLLGGRCAAAGTHHGKRRRCTRYAFISQTVVRAAHAGTNRIRFEGVLDGGVRLAPGSYRLTVGARGSAGAAQAGQHPMFTLLA